MNNVKLLKSILLVLLLVNIATLSFLWLTKPPRNNRQGSAKDFFSHELSFSAKQEQQFDSLKDLFQTQKVVLTTLLHVQSYGHFLAIPQVL